MNCTNCNRGDIPENGVREVWKEIFLCSMCWDDYENTISNLKRGGYL